MKVHPDKNPDDKEANEKFSNLHNAYNLLMDDEKRNLYNETGEIDDKLDINLENTYQYYRDIYPTITQKDIESFTSKYRNSQMEIDDLITFYEDFNGNITNILEYIPLSSNDDIDRFLNIYEGLFKSQKLKRTTKFTQTKKKIRTLQEDDSDEVAAEKGKMDDLSKQIALKNKNRNENLIENLSKKIYF